MRIGTAGWSIPRAASPSFPGDGHHLERYARGLTCAEINSSFHRSHRAAVYQRWAEQTPPHFRFSVKLPRSITHEGGLRRAREPLLRFLGEVEGLGDRLGPLLAQFPPSFAFDPRTVRRFFGVLRMLFEGQVICEPRHISWFTAAAERALIAFHIGRAAVDPARWPTADHPGGWLGASGDGRGAVPYYRWHGSPRMYRSRYELAWIQARSGELRRWPAEANCWCIFDNTAAGGASANALELQECLATFR